MSLLYKDGEFVDKEYADFTAEMYAEGHSFFTYISDSPDTLSSCCFTKDAVPLYGFVGSKYFTHNNTFEEIYEEYEQILKETGKKPEYIVYSTNYTTGKTSWVKANLVKAKAFATVKIKFDEPMYKGQLEHKYTVETTLDHKFPIKGLGDVEAKDIQVGDELIFNKAQRTLADDELYELLYLKVKEITIIQHEEPIDVYCFDVIEGDPHFTMANGLITHNCRLSNKINENSFSFTNGLTGESTGSKSVITLNYNRIVQDFINNECGGDRDIWMRDKEDFKARFKEYLTPILERVYKYHTAYNEILWELYEAHMLPVYSAGFIHLNKQYLTLGLNGVNEAWMFLGGECRYSDDYKEFCKLICGTMKEQNAAHKTKKTMFNSEFVPKLSGHVKPLLIDLELLN